MFTAPSGAGASVARRADFLALAEAPLDDLVGRLGQLFLALAEAARLLVVREFVHALGEVRLALLVGGARRGLLPLGKALVGLLRPGRFRFIAVGGHSAYLPGRAPLKSSPVRERTLDEPLPARPVDRAAEGLAYRRVGETQLARGPRAVVMVTVEHGAHHLPADRRRAPAQPEHALDQCRRAGRHRRGQE